MNPQRRTDIEVEDDDDELPLEEGPDRTDGTVELTQGDVFYVLFNDPAVRNYVIAAFAALGMIFLLMMQQASDLGGLLIVVFGICGILFRWTVAPALVLVITCYFMVTPSGVPGEWFSNRWEIREGRFRPVDLILAMSVLVYIACQFRILSFVKQAIAFEGLTRRRNEPLTRRPAAVIGATELAIFLGIAFGLVIAGQLLWWLVNAVELAPGSGFPYRWADEDFTLYRSRSRRRIPGGMSPGFTRFMVLIGLLCFSVLLARLVFGYWRLRAMPPAEGAMILLDGNWEETKRERSRLEKWRNWGKKREQAKQPEATKEDT